PCRRAARRPGAARAERLALGAQGGARGAGAYTARIRIDASFVRVATARALASGALQPIATQSELIDGFVVRAASTIAARAAAAQRADPLGDYEPDLFVGDVGSAHYVLLNKFPLLPNP